MVLWILMAAMLLMPVSYRAGTEQSHPHTIFQGLIDLVTGEPHHHHEAETAQTTRSPFAPLTVPLGLLGDAGHQDDLAISGVPDIPRLLGVSMPISDQATIQALAVLIALLFAGSATRALWTAIRALDGIVPGIESPPPRPAA